MNEIIATRRCLWNSTVYDIAFVKNTTINEVSYFIDGHRESKATIHRHKKIKATIAEKIIFTLNFLNFEQSRSHLLALNGILTNSSIFT